MAGTLTEINGEHAGRMHVLETADIRIGRASDNDVVVMNALASRHHARIFWDGRAHLVEDLGTRNGTLVDRQRVSGPRPLADGDQIDVPGVSLVFRSSDRTMTMVATVARRRDTLTFLFADLRDYTTFIEHHGDVRGAELIGQYRGLMNGEIAKAEGAVVKTEGDGYFVVFESARGAVECAVAVLREAARRNEGRPEAPLRIGIGIHAGEPEEEDGQYVGSAVNIAARLAQTAAAGELQVSEVVRGIVRTSGIAPMREKPGVTLKGVDEPPRVFVVEWSATSQT